jgi:hypothetical protein
MRERGFPGSLVEANRAGMIAATLNWVDFSLAERGAAIFVGPPTGLALSRSIRLGACCEE